MKMVIPSQICIQVYFQIGVLGHNFSSFLYKTRRTSDFRGWHLIKSPIHIHFLPT